MTTTPIAHSFTVKPPRPPRLTGHMGRPPCGRECMLDAAHRHVFCSCADDSCSLCHSADRFRWSVPWREPRP
jgi:hypothetical protein